MKEFEDNSQTMEFDAVKEAPQEIKPQQNRSANDQYTAARRGRGYEIKKEKGNGALIAIACSLTILLVVALVATILILKGDKKEEPQKQNDEAIVVENEEEKAPEEEEEIPEIQNKIISCDLVFNPSSMEKEDDGFSIRADFFDSEMNQFETRRIIINEETDIRRDGERLAPEGFIYILENSGGDQIVFKGEIREKDDVVIAISFESQAVEEAIEEEKTSEETPALEAETESAPVEETPAPQPDPAPQPAPQPAPEAETTPAPQTQNGVSFE